MANHADYSVRQDALERAARTLWQGIGVDAVTAIGAGLTVQLAGGDVTSPVFWSGVGVLVIKSFLTAAASYMTRLTVTPKKDS